MELNNSHVYFTLKGDNFDPKIVTERIGIEATESWKKGEKGKYNPKLEFSCWKFSTSKEKESIEIEKLVNEIVEELFDKIEIINELKNQFQLDSTLEIVLDIDINPENPTPVLGHELKTIEFLYKTKTKADIDIYRFDSRT